MNVHAHRTLKSSRRLFTVGDVLRMQDSGVIEPDERLELFEGELIRMQAKNYAHERIKLRLIREFILCNPEGYTVGVETTAYLSDATYLDPDISLIPENTDIKLIPGHDIALVVEVADATLAKDRGPKARLYAKYGVRELWVVDAKTLRTHRFASPDNGVWTEQTVIEPHVPLVHPLLKGLSLRLADV